MKTPQELYEEWTDGEQNGMRPKRVQALRDDFEAATDLSVPHDLAEIDGWLEGMRSSGAITRKLKRAAEGSDDSGEEGGDSENAEEA